MTLSHVPSTKNNNRKDEFENWPASIKSTFQWFPFLEIMEYTGNDMQNDTHLTSSLLKIFSLFEIRLSCVDVDLETVSLKCINCEKETGLKSKTGVEEFYDKIITPFVMNAMLHHVGMSWIICSKK